MKNQVAGLLTILLLLGSNLIAQESRSQSHSDLQQKFDFNNESGLKEVKLEVGSDMDMIGFNFQSEISSGSLTMSIFDPNGKREGGFVLQAVHNKSEQGKQTTTRSSENSTSNSSSSSSSNDGQTIVTNSGNNTHQYVMHSGGGQSVGSMNKQVDNPISGTWSVNIEMKDLKGKLALTMMQQGQE